MKRSRPQSALSGLRALLAARKRKKEEKEEDAAEEEEITNSSANKEKQQMEEKSTTKNVTIEDKRVDSPYSTIHSLTISESEVKAKLKANGTHHTGDPLKNCTDESKSDKER